MSIVNKNSYDNSLTSSVVFKSHSNIYDITPFLFTHPGLPETLLVHSGKDASVFFEDMGHSMGARRMAISLCVVVDMLAQNENECRVLPTMHTKVHDDSRIPRRVPDGSDNLLLQGRRQARSRKEGTLHRIRTQFVEERDQIRRTVNRKYGNDPTVLGQEVNPYYDPFNRVWRIWYTSTDMQRIFLPA